MIGPNPVSYRDPNSSVELRADHIIRVFRGRGAEDFEAFYSSPLFAELIEEGKLVPFERTDESDAVVQGTSPRYWSVTYPYEWSFSMLKDAGLLTLELAERAFEAGFELRDASAFNVVFVDGMPVWVDLGSFGKRRAGIWQAYAQFLDHYLNPLAAAAYSGEGVVPEWSASLEGLSARLARRRTSLGFLARHRLLRHVALRARLQRAAEGKAEHSTPQGSPTLPQAALIRLLRGLRKSLEGLEPNYLSHWTVYDRHNTYTGSEETAKAKALAELVDHLEDHTLALDVGANTGRYAALLAASFERVIAMDSDEGAVDAIYRGIKSGRIPANVLPVVGDVIALSSGRGLLGRERAAMLDRFGRASLATWLAVVHHLAVGRNVPMPLIRDLMLAVSDRHIMEFVSRDDPMVATLLSRREEEVPYSYEGFVAEICSNAKIVDRHDLSPTRSLFLLDWAKAE